MKYCVELTKAPVVKDFRADYFPRKFRYLKAARELVAEVQRKGGDAVIVSPVQRELRLRKNFGPGNI